MTAIRQVPQVLWERYARERSPELKRELVLKYFNLVGYVVSRYTTVLTGIPTALEVQDLVQVGVIGLLDAIDRFDPKRGVKFETYAVTRIRGTIQDELRKLDWVPRSVRTKTRSAECPAHYTQALRKQRVSLQELAVNYSLSGNECRRIIQNAEGAIEDMIGTREDDARIMNSLPTGTAPDVSEEVARDQLRTMLLQLVEKLPDDERLIITLYYYEDLTFKEIGNILRLSESRISQKHAGVVKKLRKELGGA
jgi:RNA polymerase sigma factor for flagellar operon FliA